MTDMNNPGPAKFSKDLSFISCFLEVLEPIEGRKPGVTVMRRKVVKLLKEARSSGTLENMVRQMVFFTGLQDLLPARYSKFQVAVVEGVIYMMSQLPISRLAEKTVDQLRLPSSANLGRRLYTLLKDMPSLQKLGQVICRTPGLDPEFKQTLVDLEDNIKTVTYGQLHPILTRDMETLDPDHSIVPEKRILAEATVCAVVPAQVSIKKEKRAVRAVLKMVKPAVRKNMPLELALLDRLVAFLDRHKKAWGLGEFNFKGTLDQVSRLLENEVDLVSEQRNLDVARTYYGSNATVVVPQKLAVSTPAMTVLSRLEGAKITDVGTLTKRQRRLLASSLAKICILGPIQDMREESIFHGDPHAGNLAYTFDGARPRIIFYDWGMLGRLKRLERFTMALLTLGLIIGNRKSVFYTADLITKGQISSNKAIGNRINGIIDEAITSRREGERGILSTIEFLFEKFTYQGVVFSTDLLMYEKALITLKGVLADIDPTFNRDNYMVWAVMTTFLDDIIRLRLLKMVIKETWALYSNSLSLLLDIQKVVFWFLWDVGRLVKNLPEAFTDKLGQETIGLPQK